METTFFILTIASLVVLVGFIALSSRKFGLQPSYSAFNICWDRVVHINNMHLWSVVTFVVAGLLIAPLIELGKDNHWQFLGFFMPVYLIVVAIFPMEEVKDDDSEYDKKQKHKKLIIHSVAAAVCAIAAILWILLVCKIYWLMPVAFLVMWCAAYATSTVKSCYIFWLEMVMFASTYAAILIKG